jgi:hypothetical protein
LDYKSNTPWVRIADPHQQIRTGILHRHFKLKNKKNAPCDLQGAF